MYGLTSEQAPSPIALPEGTTVKRVGK